MSDAMNPMFMNNPPATVPIEDKRVGFGKRFGAWFIDLIVTLIGAAIINVVLGSMLATIAAAALDASLAGSGVSADDLSNNPFGSLVTTASAFGVAGAIAGILMSLLELLMGMSVGKMALGIQIAHADGRRGDISLWGVRWALKEAAALLQILGFFAGVAILGTISSIVSLIFFIGCFVALSASKQALHDIIAKTAVFHKGDITD